MLRGGARRMWMQKTGFGIGSIRSVGREKCRVASRRATRLGSGGKVGEGATAIVGLATRSRFDRGGGDWRFDKRPTKQLRLRRSVENRVEVEWAEEWTHESPKTRTPLCTLL